MSRQFSTTRSRKAINKIVSSAEEAIQDMRSGTTLLVGGFGFSGVPDTLINALYKRMDLKDFTVVSNNAGMPGVGLGKRSKTLPQFYKLWQSSTSLSNLFQGNCWRASKSAKW